MRFGPAGNSQIFYDQGHKATVEAPGWLNRMGLSAFEYPCGRGVMVKADTARQIGHEAWLNDIAMSLHAPYFINLASPDPEKQERTLNYFRQSLVTARFLGAKRVVFHPGALGGDTRENAMARARALFDRVLDMAREEDCEDILLCPETAGKTGQLGTLDEVIALAKMRGDLVPTIDFGHVHAAGQGCLNTQEDFARVLDRLEDGMGELAKGVHIHFSRLEYTQAGEKRHWTFADTEYGPDFEPLAELIVARGYDPVIICESAGTMAEDALAMMEMVEKLCTNA